MAAPQRLSLKKRIALIITGLLIFSVACVYRLFLYPSSRPHPIPTRPRPSTPPKTPIPANIWQIYFTDVGVPASITQKIEIWRVGNPFHHHHLVNDSSAIDYVVGAYPTRLDIVETFKSLTVPVLKSDYLRYLLLSSYGGVYADTDTEPLHAIQTWVPAEDGDDIRAVIGIEFDRGDAAERVRGPVYDVQFAQWTIASAPNHPILVAAVDEVTRRLKTFEAELALSHRTMEQALNSESGDMHILELTGPVMWTETVMRILSKQQGRQLDWHEFSGLKKPKRFGDTLIMPIDAFGQERSAKSLVYHAFSGTWRAYEPNWASWFKKKLGIQ